MSSRSFASSIATPLGLTLAVFSAACGDTESFTLTLTKAGGGSGSVTAPGLTCGTGCTLASSSYEKDTSVTITATPDSGSKIAGWTGCDTATGANCTIAMTENRAVTVTFELESTEYTLTVEKSGSGSGTITGTGITCGSDCSESFAAGTEVTLTATPEFGSSLESWTGCGSTNGSSCVVTMTQNRSVTAVFTAAETIVISADITVATTWLTGKIYRITVPIDVTAPLTIQPGVVIQLDPEVSIRVTSTIHADGLSPETPIVFTSAAQPAAGGDWEGISLATNGSIFKYCAILYAGANDKAGLEIRENISATVSNCIFAHHRTPTDSISAKPALDASEAAAGTVIESNIFFDNRVPLIVSTKMSPGVNTFDNALAAPLDPQPNKYNALFIAGCGHISGSIVWPALAVPYVIGDPITACDYVAVDNGGQLTIGSASANAIVKLFDGGVIDVAGGIVPHAIFTSVRDDARGGDTNGDGNATLPAPGDWEGLWLKHSGAVFDGAGFYYAGGDDHSALRIFADVAATVRNTMFGHNKPTVDGLTAAPALDASEAAAATIIEGNTFFDNTVPLSISTDFSIDDSNVFAYAENGGSTLANKYQAVIVAGCGHIGRALTWGQVKVPMVIGDPNTACDYVYIDAGASLAIADGSIVKFFSGGAIDATGVINANAATQIVFTSIRDDAHGGDTNADGAASVPAGGDWDGMKLNTSGSSFTKVQFLYAGAAADGDDHSALTIAEGKSVSVRSSVFAHTRTAGDTIMMPAALDLSEASPVGLVLEDNRFYDNTIPLSINANLSIDNSNRFDSGVPSAPLPNRFNGIIVRGCSRVESTTSWGESEVPFVIGDPVTACDYLTIEGGGHLTVTENVTMKFFLDGALYFDPGAGFTVGSGAWFTSIKDDHVNDTNGDESATTPAVGDWYGIKYAQSGADPICDQSSYMHYNLPNIAGECAF